MTIDRPASHRRRRIAAIARRATAFGLLLVLLLPAARGHNAWLGWWPLWLVAMPAAAWWAAAGFRVVAPEPLRHARRRRGRSRPQARRLAARPRQQAMPRVA